MKETARIGIYAGTFDPVHSGHVAFALQAAQAADLEKVYFLPERRPRAKPQVEHFGHRVAMLRQALKPHPQLELLEMTDANFSVNRTLPRLRRRFSSEHLVFLMGSDVAKHIAEWPEASSLLKDAELVIGIRSRDKRDELRHTVEDWPARPSSVVMFNSFAPAVSSGIVREALRSGRAAPGLLTSVERYSGRNWLYVSLSDKPAS